MRIRGVSLALALCVAPIGVIATRAAQQDDVPEKPARNRQANVLFLSADDFTRPYVRLLFDSFSDVLNAAADPPAIYFETVDALRFEERPYLEDFRGWLRNKYKNRSIDLVIALSDPALRFLASAGGEPWPNAQVLYFESGYIRVDTHTLPHVGGMLIEDAFPPAMEVIKTVLPDTKRVALIYGASAAEVVRFDTYVEKLRKANLEAVELVGRSIEETRTQVAQLPAGTVALILSPTVDAQGHVISPSVACERISSAASVPTITLGAQDLGCGTLGGLMREWSKAGRLLGEDALARLTHPSDRVVTVHVAQYTTLAFDDRQLLRWRIPERRLPAGADVRFREPNLWRDHRALVLAALGVTILQTLLIAGLVLEHRRRRRAEIDSRRHLAGLAHLDRRAAMGELATSLAHELNQPLNAILQNAGVAQMMLKANTVPPALSEMTDIISDIRKDDIRASEVIKRMRGLLQKRELESQPVDLTEIAQETIAIIRPDAMARAVHLEAELADNMPAIVGDRVHLQQVLLNLLMNALDAVAAMPPDRRRVRVSTGRSDGEVRLSVVDTGKGIPVDRLAEIFEPFYTTKIEGSGMGMGLAIARNIVEAHGGRMAAENNSGGGALVWFSLPIQSAIVRPPR